MNTKSTWMWPFGLILLALIVASGKYAGVPSEAARSLNRAIAMPTHVAIESGGDLPAKLSEYVILHQTRYESIPVDALATVHACPG